MLDIAEGIVVSASDGIYPLSENEWVLPWNLR